MERFLQPGVQLRPKVVAKAKAKGRAKQDEGILAFSIEQTRVRSCHRAKTQELLERMAVAEQKMAHMQDTLTALSLQEINEQISALLSANEQLQGIIEVTLAVSANVFR